MEPILFVRLLKLIAVSLFVAGSLGVTVSADKPTQRRFAFWFAGPGFGLTWLLGFFLLALRHERVMATWVLGSMATSFVAINIVIYLAVGKEDRRRPMPILLIALTLISSFALMVLRPA